MKSYVYLHGFASSPASSKAQYFKVRLAERGVLLQIPELDGKDFEHLTLSSQLEAIERALQGEPAVLLGSSMGGYLAALYAQRHPEVERLVLLAPAFDFRRRWAQRVGAEEIANWKANGTITVFHYGRGCACEIDYRLYDDSARYPAYPDFSQPVLVLHGTHDEVVLPEVARTFCGLHPNAQLHLFESGHELTNVLPELWAVTEPFLFT